MPTDRRIDYVEFPAGDFDEFQKFYSTVFGWKFTDYGPEYRAFSDGVLEGGIFHSELRSRTENGSALIVLYADDLESAQRRVLDHGGTISREIILFPVGRRFLFFDPHGNELGVWSDKLPAESD